MLITKKKSKADVFNIKKTQQTATAEKDNMNQQLFQFL